MKITSKDAMEITFDDLRDDSDFKLIEEGTWIDDGKYSYIESIFECKGKTYSLDCTRSGSYFSDYYYCWEDQDTYECREVKKIEVIAHKWVSIDTK